jgi:diacylglycerol kinase (ATP)
MLHDGAPVRTVIVHNVSAGDHRYDGDRLMELVRRAGHDAVYFVSTDERWKAAAPDADLVAAAGGDGTVEDVAKTIVDADTGAAMTVLPLGTANNVSRGLGLADTPLESLIHRWATAPIRRLDMGVATGPWGIMEFLESVGAGLVAAGIAEIVGGASAYVDDLEGAERRVREARDVFLERLQRADVTPFAITLDGDHTAGEFVLVEAMNFGTVGPQLRLSSDADPSDGWLDVVLVPEKHRSDLARHLTPSPSGTVPPPLPVRRARRVTLTCRECQIHVGDTVWTDPPWAHEKVTIELTLRAQALRFAVPATSV